MPKYEYRCKGCEDEFTARLSISERHAPSEIPCHSCGAFEVVLKVGTPLVSYSTNPGMRTSDNFNARMQEIKKNKGVGNTIDVRSGGV